MYFHIQPVPEVSTSVLEPVAEQVLRYIISRLGFSNIFTNNLIFESGHEGVTKSTNDQEQRVIVEDKIICNVTNILSPTETPFEALNTNHITSEGFRLNKIKNQYPVFSDIINKLFIFSLDRPAAIQLEAKFVFKDRTIAYELGERMFTIFSNGMTIPVMDIMFDYPIPEQLVANFYELYKMTEGSKVIGANFIDYLKEGSNAHITLKQNKLIPKHSQIVIQRTLENSLVKIEFQDPNVNAEKKNKSPIKFNNQMTITIQFSKPSDIVIGFPIMVNDELVPYPMIPANANPIQPPIRVYPEIPLNNFIKHVDACFVRWCVQFWDKATLEAITDPNEWESKLKDAWTHIKNENMVRIPDYDNWIPPKEPRFPSNQYKPIGTIVFTIDPALGYLKLHWKNDIQPLLGLSDAVINYLAVNENKIFYIGLDFLVAVYRDDRMLDQSALDNDRTYLTITSKKKNAIHRLVIYSRTYRDNFQTFPTFQLGIFDLTVMKK